MEGIDMKPSITRIITESSQRHDADSSPSITPITDARKAQLKPTTSEILVHAPGKEAQAQIEEGLRIGTILAQASNYTRRIACKPGNVINPPALAAEARALAAREKLKCTVIDAAKAQKLGMGGLVGVGQGSANLFVELIDDLGGRVLRRQPQCRCATTLYEEQNMASGSSALARRKH